MIKVRVEACSKALGGPPESYSELWYRVAAAPTENIDMLATSAVKETVYRVARDVAPWLRRNRNARAIGIVLAVPMGRWAEDIQFLLDCFPNAQFEVHMQSQICRASRDARVAQGLGPVGGRSLALDLVTR